GDRWVGWAPLRRRGAVPAPRRPFARGYRRGVPVLQHDHIRVRKPAAGAHGLPDGALAARILRRVVPSVEADAEIDVHAIEVRIVPGRHAASAGRAPDELVGQQVVVLEAPADLERADVEVDAATERDGGDRLAMQ